MGGHRRPHCGLRCPLTTRSSHATWPPSPTCSRCSPPPGGAHGVGEGIFGFLTSREACPLRLVSSVLCADVKNARWYDRDTVITSDLRMWRACFSDARCANVSGRRDLVDADLVHLSGVEEVNLSGCTRITDAGLAHLRGVRVLDIAGCTLITDAGLAHLTGTHTLDMGYCTRITDAGLAHLTGIHTLDMSWCTQITEAGLAHLTGIQTLYVRGCNPATIAASRALRLIALSEKRVFEVVAHLTGIRGLRR